MINIWEIYKNVPEKTEKKWIYNFGLRHEVKITYRVEFILSFHVVFDKHDIMNSFFNGKRCLRFFLWFKFACIGHDFGKAIVKAVQVALEVCFGLLFVIRGSRFGLFLFFTCKMLTKPLIFLSDVQLTTHQWIQTTPYVCNERIFGGLLFAFNKIFLKDSLPRFVALTFTLLLAPFESKLFNN